MAALTEKGFQRPLYADILAQKIARAQELFGSDISTDEKTPLGKFIRLDAYDLAEAYEDMENVYYAGFPDTARGVDLDRQCVAVSISRNPPTNAVHSVEFTGTVGYIIPAGFLVGTADGIEFHTEQDATIGSDGKVTAEVYCSDYGTVGNVAPPAISEIINPDAEVESIRHISIVTPGQDQETDPTLRSRYHLASAGAGSATSDAIKAEIMRVSNVKGCIVVENDTDVVDADGRPPNSFECYVFAPEDQDNDVAAAIFRKKPIGIRTTGSVTVQVQDAGGFSHDVKFSRVTNVPIYVKATVKVSSEFEADGHDQIVSNLTSYFNSLTNGDDVILSRMYSYIHSVTGVVETSELLISTDGTTYDAQSVPCSPSQVAVVGGIDVEVAEYVDS